MTLVPRVLIPPLHGLVQAVARHEQPDYTTHDLLNVAVFDGGGHARMAQRPGTATVWTVPTSGGSGSGGSSGSSGSSSAATCPANCSSLPSSYVVTISGSSRPGFNGAHTLQPIEASGCLYRESPVGLEPIVRLRCVIGNPFWGYGTMPGPFPGAYWWCGTYSTTSGNYLSSHQGPANSLGATGGSYANFMTNGIGAAYDGCTVVVS